MKSKEIEDSEKIRQFTLNFFKSLGCKIYWRRKTLIIEDIPQNFQDFFGKKEPFRFVFEEKDNEGDAEIVSKGSSLIKKMNEFLDEKGQTALVKLEVEVEDKVIKENYPLMNCSISQITRKNHYRPIVRFVFLTHFNYLNEKDQEMNAVYVMDGKTINFDPSKYKSVEGNKRDLYDSEFEEEYEIAKEKLKDLIEDKKKESANKVKELLKKEIERIEKHHQSNVEETRQKIEKIESQIKESERSGNYEKLKKLNESLSEIDFEKEVKQSEEEKDFLISQEIEKHKLGVRNKLLNMTIFYYPLIKFGVFLKGERSKRMVEIEYDPIKKEISEVYCDCCKNKVSEIILCSSGHLICRECGDRCGLCKSVVCGKCNIKECHYDKKKFCEKCVSYCSECKRVYCKEHLTKSDLSGSHICKNCSSICPECHKTCEKGSMKEGVCMKCWSKRFGEKLVNSF